MRLIDPAEARAAFDLGDPAEHLYINAAGRSPLLRASHAAAQASLRAASDASRPEFVRKLGAIDAQHASLGELHALLEEELEFCKAEMAEIHAKHDATLEAQIKAERAVRSSQDQEYEQQLQTLQQQQQKLEAG